MNKYEARYKTLRHMETVRNYINVCIRELLIRGEQHDQTKLESPEVELFDEHTKKLRGLTYGTKEYSEALSSLDPALKHHYAHNRHHPQHFKNGIRDMNLFDIIEMFCDWEASSRRQNDGNILLSLEENKKRFHLSDDLYCILENTAKYIDEQQVFHHAEQS